MCFEPWPSDLKPFLHLLMPHADFHEFTTHRLVAELFIEWDGAVPGMEHDARETATRGFCFGFHHHQPAYAEALLPVIHGHLSHLDGPALHWSEQQCAQKHIFLPGGQVVTGGFRGQLGLGELQAQGFTQDIAAQSHR